MEYDSDDFEPTEWDEYSRNSSARYTSSFLVRDGEGETPKGSPKDSDSESSESTSGSESRSRRRKIPSYEQTGGHSETDER